MNQGIISQQVNLSYRRIMNLALKSLKKRFARSLITMFSVILAIAFLMYILTSTAIIEGIKDINDSALTSLLLRNGVDLAASGMSNKDIWLVTLSLLVCSVGILNAMLMSVGERFKEIGTMKCLGARNSAIIKLFMVEAGIQGSCGTLAGVLGGILFAFVMNAVTYGFDAVLAVPVGRLVFYFMITFFIGLGLSIIFAIYPAYVAASMQPVDAMRVEE